MKIYIYFINWSRSDVSGTMSSCKENVFSPTPITWIIQFLKLMESIDISYTLLFTVIVNGSRELIFGNDVLLHVTYSWWRKQADNVHITAQTIDIIVAKKSLVYLEPIFLILYPWTFLRTRFKLQTFIFVK